MILITVIAFSSCFSGKITTTVDKSDTISNTSIENIEITEMDNMVNDTFFNELLIINHPLEEKGIVEIIGQRTLYSTGAKFTVSLVDLDNYSYNNIIWEIENNYDDKTTIDNGILNIAPKDHGRKLTITAILKEKNIYGSTSIEVVYFLPSIIYGIWVLQDDIYKVIKIISDDKFEIICNAVIPDNPNVPYHFKTDIKYWTIAENMWGTYNYPAGYSISTTITEATNEGDFKVGDGLFDSFYFNLEKTAFIRGGGGGSTSMPDESNFYLKQMSQ